MAVRVARRGADFMPTPWPVAAPGWEVFDITDEQMTLGVFTDWDGQGRLFACWTVGTQVRLCYSTNSGKTWTVLPLQPTGFSGLAYAALIARTSGVDVFIVPAVSGSKGTEIHRMTWDGAWNGPMVAAPLSNRWFSGLASGRRADFSERGLLVWQQPKYSMHGMTATSDAGGGDKPWQAPEEALVQDFTFAVVLDLPTGQYTNWLHAEGAGLDPGLDPAWTVAQVAMSFSAGAFGVIHFGDGTIYYRVNGGTIRTSGVGTPADWGLSSSAGAYASLIAEGRVLATSSTPDIYADVVEVTQVLVSDLWLQFYPVDASGGLGSAEEVYHHAPAAPPVDQPGVLLLRYDAAGQPHAIWTSTLLGAVRKIKPISGSWPAGYDQLGPGHPDPAGLEDEDYLGIVYYQPARRAQGDWVDAIAFDTSTGRWRKLRSGNWSEVLFQFPLPDSVSGYSYVSGWAAARWQRSGYAFYVMSAVNPAPPLYPHWLLRGRIVK